MTNPKLTIELVPRTAWFNNVRSNVAPEIWQKLKKRTATKAKWRCEICGGQGKKWAVECHEIWNYDDVNHRQTLQGLIALCPSCHAVKHMGHTNLQGKAIEATLHLAKINGWSCEEAVNYVETQFQVWQERSQYDWELDISWLENINL